MQDIKNKIIENLSLGYTLDEAIQYVNISKEQLLKWFAEDPTFKQDCLTAQSELYTRVLQRLLALIDKGNMEAIKLFLSHRYASWGINPDTNKSKSTAPTDNSTTDDVVFEVVVKDNNASN